MNRRGADLVRILSPPLFKILGTALHRATLILDWIRVIYGCLVELGRVKKTKSSTSNKRSLSAQFKLSFYKAG